jgi:hypothetical protein
VVAIPPPTAQLTHQTIRPRAGIRMHAPANVVRRFVDATRETSIPQSQGSIQSGNTGTNDNDTYVFIHTSIIRFSTARFL